MLNLDAALPGTLTKLLTNLSIHELTVPESVSRYRPHPAPRQHSMKPLSRPSPRARAKTNSAASAARQKTTSNSECTNLLRVQRLNARKRSYTSPKAAPVRSEYAAWSA